jgi:hypothetical protein
VVRRDTKVLETDNLDEEVEVIDVIGRASADVSPALAAKRAAIVAKELRLQLSRPGRRSTST